MGTGTDGETTHDSSLLDSEIELGVVSSLNIMCAKVQSPESAFYNGQQWPSSGTLVTFCPTSLFDLLVLRLSPELEHFYSIRKHTTTYEFQFAIRDASRRRAEDVLNHLVENARLLTSRPR